MNTEQESKAELLARLDVMEAMMQAGRRATQYCGWIFVLWGAAFMIATGWTLWLGHRNLAWPVTMVAAGVLSAVIGSQRRLKQPKTNTYHAISAIWIAVGTALFLYLFSISYSGYAEVHSFWAALETLLGAANFASALILRWRIQILVALTWWTAAVASCFVSGHLLLPILMIATLLCQIGYGLYLLYCEHRDRRTSTTAVQHG